MFHFFSTPLRPAGSRCAITLVELAMASTLFVGIGNLMPFVMGLLPWVVACSIWAVIVGLVVTYWRHGPLGWANRVTLGRAVLVALVAGGVAHHGLSDAIWLWLGVALIALMLDGVDGWIARHTHSHSNFGARFDMELDALLILLLCVGLIVDTKLGPWVLLVGLMRYFFVAAGALLPWLEAPLFPSYRRKTVCVWQVAALLLALTPLTNLLTAQLLVLSALGSLIYSFGVDTWWLYRHARQHQ